MPWTVTIRWYKCLFKPLGLILACHPWTLDFGIHAEMTAFGRLVYNDEISAWECGLGSSASLGLGKQSLPSGVPKRSLGTSEKLGVAFICIEFVDGLHG